MHGISPGGSPWVIANLSVDVKTDGDFRIDDVLLPIPPDPCANAVLLILSAGGSWFAAGIPKL